MRTQYTEWEDYYGLAREIEEDLHSTEIPDKTIKENTIYTRYPKEGTVFTYPSNFYLETKDKYAEYADIVESVISGYANVERWDVTTRTDGKPNKHYWEILSVKE